MRKRKNRVYVLTWTLVMALFSGNGLTAFAASPEFARTAGEWQKLRDNVLEYEEVEDLVHEYNPTVRSNAYSYQKFLKDYGKTNEKVSSAYQDAADEIEGTMSGESDAGSVVSDLQAKLQADELRKQADETIEDSKIKLLTYEQAEKTLASNAQSNMITYFSRQEEVKQKETALKSAELDLALVQTRRAAGSATEIEGMTARETVGTARENLTKAQNSVQEIKEKLLLSLGWSHNDNPEIKELPEWNPDDISSMNPESDLAQTLENNYTLKINRQKLENSKSKDTKEDLSRTIKNNEKQIAASLTAAYRNVLTAKAAWETAKKSSEQSQENKRIGALKLQAGMITDNEYQKLETAESSSQSQEKIEKLALLSAMEQYRWAVRGLASAS